MDTGIVSYSPEWFTARQGAFTASDAWKLTVDPKTKKAQEAGELSQTTETYVLEKVWETLSGQTAQGIDNMATQWGVEQEPNAVKWYVTKTENKVTECGLFSTEQAPLFATPDRLVNDDGSLEVKCPFTGSNHLAHCFITTDEYFKEKHREYYWQIQTQLLVTEREWCDFVSFDPRIDSKLGLFIYRLKRNEDDINLLIDRAKKARNVYDNYLNLFSK